MAADLTGQNIEDTYPRILQIYNGQALDGTGSLAVVTVSGSFSGNGSGLYINGGTY